jgi:tetratricopeptide (TPR) repeat protein
MQDTLEIVKKADQYRSQKGDTESAIKLLEEHVDMLREDPLLSFDIPLILKSLGTCYRDIGNTNKALELYKEALELSRNDFNKIEESDILSSMAFLELKIGSIDQALKYAKQSLKYIGNKRGEKFGIAKSNAHAVLGNIYFENGDYEDALLSYKRALSVAENINFEKRIITVVGDIANVYVMTGKYDEARKLLKKYIEKAEKSYRIAIPQYYLRLGKVFLNKGDLKKAEENFLIAMHNANENKLIRDMGESSEALGDLYRKKDKSRADKYYKDAVTYYVSGSYKKQAEYVKKKLKN